MTVQSPEQKSSSYSEDTMPPGALIFFVHSARRMDVIGFHPTHPDVEIASTLSGKRRTMTEERYEAYDHTVSYTIEPDTKKHTDFVLEISERRYYGDEKHRKQNEIRTGLSQLSFDGSPVKLPRNEFNIAWNEGRDGEITRLSQLAEVEGAYRVETLFNAKNDETKVTAAYDGEVQKLTIGNLMTFHRCVSPPGLWPEADEYPTYLHSILRKHPRARVHPLTSKEPKLREKLDIIARTAHIQSCAVCISDLIEFH